MNYTMYVSALAVRSECSPQSKNTKSWADKVGVDVEVVPATSAYLGLELRRALLDVFAELPEGSKEPRHVFAPRWCRGKALCVRASYSRDPGGDQLTQLLETDTDIPYS